MFLKMFPFGMGGKIKNARYFNERRAVSVSFGAVHSLTSLEPCLRLKQAFLTRTLNGGQEG